MARIVRTQRLAERIRQDLSQILQLEVTDPALEGITVTDVTVDRELAYAKIFISALEGSARKDSVLEALERAKGFLRFQLAQRIELRSFPQLRFKWDPTPERAERIEKLLSSLSTDSNDITDHALDYDEETEA